MKKETNNCSCLSPTLVCRNLVSCDILIGVTRKKVVFCGKINLRNAGIKSFLYLRVSQNP